MNNNKLPRLAYLASEYRPQLPSRKLMRFVPMADMIKALATHGISGASLELDLSPDQLEHLFFEGKSFGTGNEQEFKFLLGQAISAEIDARRDQLILTDYFAIMSDLHAFVSQEASTLVEWREASLADVIKSTPMPKWSSGFDPFDEVTGGFYQGLFMLIGRPGSGKTTFMMSFMEALRRTNQASSVWFFETEIPLELMLYRNNPSRSRVKFLPDDRIICGMPMIQDIIERVKENPDPNRVIIIDSPDVIAGGIGEARRFAIEDAYRDLIRLKGLCKLVLVASQGRRQDRDFTLDSPSEAWSKAFYIDGMIAVNRMMTQNGQWSQVRVKMPKNRFGPVDREVIFDYNYEDLSFQMTTPTTTEDSDW